MKASSPSPTIFDPELSHALQVLKFMQVKTEPIFAKALGIKEPDVNADDPATTEGTPKNNPFHVHPDFPFSVQRDFSDDIEVAIEVVHYRQPGNNKYLDHRDPNYEAGEVQFGDAVVVATGKTIELTELEWEAAEAAFWNTGSR